LDPDDASSGLGYSSYFALDITKNFNASDSSTYPVLRWEFNDPELGYATPGAAIVKINANSDPKNKNGRWFAVLASGPTGPIDTVKHQFLGRSDQNLKIFVLDLKTGEVVSKTSGGTPGPMDTGITNAFASSITNSIIDTERWNTNEAGKRRYQDDGLYIGYTQKAGDGTWTQGGVLRIIIPDDTDPDAIDTTLWKMSKVIDGIGPVTSAISKLQDRKNHNLWLYFGTGRYFYNQDDMSGQRRIFGVRDLCYKSSVTHTDGTTTMEDLDDKLCVSAATTPAAFDLSSLSDQTSGTDTTLSNSNGWYIDLDAAGTSYGAERVISDPVAMTNGAVYYTSFKPNADLCSFGGNSYLWAVKYDTGTAVPSKALQGKALLQLSTGSFEEKDLSTEFTDKNSRRSGSPMSGKPPLDPPPIISKSNLKPVKRIIHIQER
jgi:type IV pilus assembly protein PilY1